MGEPKDAANQTSLALDTNAQPAISYYQSKDYVLKFAYRDLNGWHLETVDSTYRAGSINRLAISQNDEPHIIYSYYDSGSGGERFKHAVKTAGGWQITPLSLVNYLDYFDFCLDSAGFPHVSYYDGANKEVFYAYQDAGGWHSEKIDAMIWPDSYPGQTSFALDDLGQPHISYILGTRAVYQYKDAGGWHGDQFDIVDDDQYSRTVLQLDRLGKPHIAYFDEAIGLKVAYIQEVQTPGGLTAQASQPVKQFDAAIFSAKASSGTYLTYTWDFGDGG